MAPAEAAVAATQEIGLAMLANTLSLVGDLCRSRS
jgi:multidrug efflux pump subunit AcrB